MTSAIAFFECQFGIGNAALRFMLTRLVDWLNVPPGALVRPKDPLEYYRKLRFFQSADKATDFGYVE